MSLSLDLRYGTDDIGFIEAARYGLWARLVAHKEGQLAFEFLRLWTQVQTAYTYCRLRGGTGEPCGHLRTVIQDCLKLAREQAPRVVSAITLGDGPKAGAKASDTLERMVLVAGTRINAPHPSDAPPPNGTHRSRKKDHST